MHSVLHVLPTMDPRAGGPPVVADRLAGLAFENGFSARVIAAGQAIENVEYETILLNRQVGVLSPFGRSKLRAEINRADIVHLHTLWSPLVGSAAQVARSMGKPYVLAPHGMLDPWSMKQKAIKKRLYWYVVERSTAAGAAVLLFTTQDERRLAAKAVSLDAPSEIIPLGGDVAPAKREVLAAEFFDSHPELVGRSLLVFLGRLHEKKRPEVLIKAMPDILHGRPDASALFVGGGDEGLERSLRELAASLGIEKSIVFLGHRTGREKWQALAASSVFVLPSQQENFGISVVEALRLGLPVIITKSVNIWLDVVQAKAGFAVDEVEIPKSISNTVLDLLNSAAQLRAMSQSAKELAEEKFDWRTCAASTCALYRETLGKPDG